MARSARKPEPKTDKSPKQGSTKQDKSIATPAAGEGADTAAEAESTTSSKPNIEFAGFQSGQFKSLRAVLEKRPEASASARTVAEEFAALWLPVHAVDLELLVPALKEAGVPESQSYAARVRKDLLNIVLADLIGNNHAQDTSGARLEALSDAFDGYQKAAEQEREGLGGKEGDLGRRMKAGSSASRVGFPTWTTFLERRWICWRRVVSPSQPRAGLPLGRMTCPGIQATHQSETTKAVSHRTMIADHPVDAAAAIATTPDGLRVKDAVCAATPMTTITDRAAATNPDVSRAKDGARAAVPMTTITDRAAATSPDGFRAKDGARAAVPRTMITDRAAGTSPGASQVSATVMTTMTGRAAATSSGRFMSERNRRYDEDTRSRGRDDDRNSDRGSSSRSRDDDDRNEGRSRGWYGDSEGHSEASRRGWERSDHGDSGWYGDREGHSEASRRGWQRSDHGESGWFGNSEGHSDASRRGWEDGHRSQRRDDEDGRRGSGFRQNENEFRSRSRDDDDRRGEGGRSRRSEDNDDRRPSSSGRGHGGWSGDPEGHAEASRRGWENRR